MKLHNTLTRQIDEITASDQLLHLYSCGPTVYDHIHIGNLSSFIFADTLRRTLQGSGFKVKHVMNITDVDDKTIRRSQEQFPKLDPLDALKQLTTQYTEVFMADMQAVGNNLEDMSFVNATDYIDAMQTLIRNLHQQGFAYITEDGVYFSIDAYRRSGKVYGQLTEVSAQSTSQARIQNDEYDKATAHDFALWKTQKLGEPAWEFTLDNQDLAGRPGWHIECSAMSTETLGLPFDIHTGGVDLVFPHHENEIAQSTAGQSDPTYAKLFAHNEHLLVDGQKMSKSLNNFYTLQDIRDKGFDPLAFRLLVLQAHYRNQAHFSWQNLEAAQNRLQELRALAALRWQAQPKVHDAGTLSLDDIQNQLAAIMADDLNTPQALAFLSRVATQVLTVLVEEDMLPHFEAMLHGIDKLLGLQLMSIEDLTAEQKAVIQKREAARESKDWDTADQLRDALQSEGVGLRDTNYGVIWFPL